MDRGGEEALRERSRQANELLVEQLGNQMHELFTVMPQHDGAADDCAAEAGERNAPSEPDSRPGDDTREGR